MKLFDKQKKKIRQRLTEIRGGSRDAIRAPTLKLFTSPKFSVRHKHQKSFDSELTRDDYGVVGIAQ